MGNKSKCNGVKSETKWARGIGRGNSRGQMPPRFGGLRAPKATRHALRLAWASAAVGVLRHKPWPKVTRRPDGSVSLTPP